MFQNWLIDQLYVKLGYLKTSDVKDTTVHPGFVGDKKFYN